MSRKRPKVLSTRVSPTEDARIQALAHLEGLTVCELVHRLLFPAADRRLAEVAGSFAGYPEHQEAA